MSSNGNGQQGRREAAQGARRLTLDDVVAACEAKGLLAPRQVRPPLVRKSASTVTSSRKSENETAFDPVDRLLTLGLCPPGRDGRPLEADEVLDALAVHIGVPRVHIDPIRLDADAIVRTLPRAFAQRHALLVLDPHADPMPIAAADPFDVAALETARQRIGRRLLVSLAGRAEILRLIREIYGFKSSVAAAERAMDQLPDLQNLEQFFRMRSETEADAGDSHIVRAVDHLLRYALDQRASDIHIEPKRDKAIVRLRIDGVLHTVHSLSRRVHSALVSRLKTLARMDIAEKRLPQDGRIKTEYQENSVEMRVSTLPVAFGEKAVLRVFDPTLVEKDLSDLGLDGEDLIVVEDVLSRPNGLFLVTGPTGSGKTTTLYAALKRLATGERNVSTVEDPIENICEDFNQVGVQSQVGLTFASALRTLLRQDPDVIMVGEIRDAETAAMAVQAALTGHLVLSTLHTNDAPSAVGRLLDMGAEPYLLASVLLGVAAQRLVRTPCPFCAEERQISPSDALALGLAPGTAFAVGSGCPKCRQTGYLGRTSVFEVLKMSPELSDAIHERRPSPWIRAVARSQGMRTLREVGAEKVLLSLTTPREILGVCPPDEELAATTGNAACSAPRGTPSLREVAHA